MTKYAQFLSGIIGGVITGAVFGVLGCIFAPYLGFNNMFGAEEFACSMSAGLYVIIFLPVGIFLAVWFFSKMKKYSFNTLYSLILALVLAVIGLFIRDFVSFYTFFILTFIFSILLTCAGNITLKKTLI